MNRARIIIARKTWESLEIGMNDDQFQRMHSSRKLLFLFDILSSLRDCVRFCVFLRFLFYLCISRWNVYLQIEKGCCWRVATNASKIWAKIKPQANGSETWIFFSVARANSLQNSYASHAWCVECGTAGAVQGQWPNTSDAHIKWLELIMFNVYMGNGFRGRQPSSTAAIICLFKHSLFSFLVLLSFVCLYNAREATEPHSHTSCTATLPFDSYIFFALCFNFRLRHRLHFKYWTAAALRRPPINCIATMYFNSVPATKYTQFCWLIFATFLLFLSLSIFSHRHAMCRHPWE